MSYDVNLPNYTVGADAYDSVASICSKYGKKAVAIGGKTAMSVVKEKMLESLKGTEVEITEFVWYGGESSYENVEILKNTKAVIEADMIFAIGGGKATDTAKTLSDIIGKPVFTFPTIASNCSACTAVSIMYRFLLPLASIEIKLFRTTEQLYTPSMTSDFCTSRMLFCAIRVFCTPLSSAMAIS